MSTIEIRRADQARLEHAVAWLESQNDLTEIDKAQALAQVWRSVSIGLERRTDDDWPYPGVIERRAA